MGKVLAKAPCPMCRAQGADGSGDNLVLYEDGAYCFACGYTDVKDKVLDNNANSWYNRDMGENKIVDIINSKDSVISFTYEHVPHRGLTRETLEFYGVVTKVGPQGPVSTAYPYGDKALKVRMWDKKEFYSQGEMASAGLFGQDKFQAGSAKAVTVTEGELDALSAFQMLGSRYPVVSIRASSGIARDAQGIYDYLNSYEQVYLCLDGDEVGARATSELAALFNPNKLRHVKLTKHKDANDYLVNGDEREFVSAWWAAKPYLPKGIIGDYATIEEILKKEDQQAVASYPFPTLQSMSYGIRQGELVLLTAQEKIGKTEVLRAIEYHILKTTEAAIGVIHLEESEKRSVQGLASYELGVPAHLPDAGVSTGDIIQAYTTLTKHDSRCYFYTHFGSDDPNSILDTIRYLVSVCGCRFIFLDHLTMLVSGFEGDDERRKLDYISTRLAMLTRELNFTLFIISHVNDDGLPRGSRMISKVCDLHVFLSRDKENPDASVRNLVTVTVRDNRFGGITGPGGTLAFDPKSFTLRELELRNEQ